MLDKPLLFCTKCGKPELAKEGDKAYRCAHCHFVYFHNVAAAVCAVIRYKEKVLLVERAQQPEMGKWDFPGGFVDYNENNEQALQRELKEELGLVIDSPKYLFSYPNQYLYNDVLYFTSDSFFEIRLESEPKLRLQVEEVSQFFWKHMSEVEFENMAFESSRAALKALSTR